MTASYRISSHRDTSYRREDEYRRSRSFERHHSSYRSRRSRRSRSISYDDSPHRERSSLRCPSTRGARIRVDSPEPSRCLGVFGLSVYTTEPYLKSIFESYGNVQEAIVIYDAKTRLSRGFGFVYFETVEQASWARTKCNGLEFHGRRIRVDFSITDRPHPPTPGIYKGREISHYSTQKREYSSRDYHRHHHYRERSRSRS